MSDEASRYREDEKTRPCTTCRMPVSILATKCRYCGAELGRPREETRSLSVQDLGGENIKHYAPSSNVMDALESFRTEQSSQIKRDSVGSGIPELDARSRALASAARPSHISGAKKTQSFSWGEYARYALGGITALALVAAAITIIPRFTTGTPKVDGFVNRTPALIDSHAPALDILRAAVEGVQRAPGEESEALRAQARELVAAEVNALLSAPDWSRQQLQEASSLALEASRVDPHRESQELKIQVDEESAMYNITLVSASPAENTLTFRAPRGSDETVNASDGPVLGRFRVVRITDTSVRLRDLERGNRELLWPVGGPPNSR